MLRFLTQRLLPTAPQMPSLLTRFNLMPMRFRTYGNEYQPSNLVRKRRHGYLKRLSTKAGRNILYRRRMKGRRYLTH